MRAEPTAPRPLADVDGGLASAIDAALARWPVPGLAVAVVRGGMATTHVRGVCQTDDKRPLTETTAFDLCSLGKAFTALALAHAEVEGRLSLDDVVLHHLPDWCANSEALTQQVQLRDLLAHRVGWAGTLPAEAGLAGCAGADVLVRRLRDLPSAMPLRAGFSYGNTHYVLANAVLARAAGPLATRLAPLLRALGMEHTHFDAQRFHADAGRARWHTGWGAEGPLAKEPVWPGNQGAGNTYSCARDLVAWLRFVLGLSEDAGAMWRAALQACLQPQVIVSGPARRLSRCAPQAVLCAYGLGWAVSDLHGHRVLMHGGEMPGTRAWIAAVPGAGLGIAVLCNASRPLSWAVGQLALHRLLGLPPSDWVDTAAASEREERVRWDAQHATDQDRAYQAGATNAPVAGAWQQGVAGPVRIERAESRAGASMLRFQDVPFWNGEVVLRRGRTHLRFTEPAARDIFAGLEPPLWLKPDGRLSIADFGDLVPH